MKTKKKQVSNSCGLSESIDQISNDLLFHPHPILEKVWIDKGAVCQLLGIVPRTLRRYKQKGMIACRHIDGMILYPAEQVEILMRYLMIKRS